MKSDMRDAAGKATENSRSSSQGRSIESNNLGLQETLCLLVDAVEDYTIFAMDSEGYILSWNLGGVKIKGYRAEEIIGTHFSKFYTPEDIQRGHPQAVLKSAAFHGKYEEEGWRVKKDGTLFWASIVITALMDSHGNLKGFGKVTRDLTEKRRAETALKESEERYRLLIDNIRDYALILLDSEGHVTSWNAGATKITGYEAQEILGSHFTKFYTPEDLKLGKHEIELRVATQAGRFEEEAIRVRKDGSRYWANIVITSVKDEQGKLTGFSKVTRDITEKRIIEEKLRESEERFRLMVEGVEDYAIFMLDPKGHVATWNRGAEHNKGYTSTEIIGKHFSVFYAEEDIQQGKPAFELKEAAAKGRFEDEGWRYCKDGSRFWANVIITAVFDSNRHLIGFSKVTRNLTERKKAEDELKSAFNALEQRVQERTQELSEAKIKAENAVKARDQFFSMASHELKTPIASLKLQSQLRLKNILRGDFKDFAKENLVELCEDDERQVNKLAYLVDNMLDISKLTAGVFELEKKPMDLAVLLKSTVRTMEPSLRETGNTCKLDIPNSVMGYWDTHRLEQVFTNLLTNCSKYAAGKPVEISLRQESSQAVILFKDYGNGIAKEKQEIIFNPFERLNTREASGLGLGLFIIHQIIKAHGGHIALTSEVGQGSTFEIILPLNSNTQEGNS